MLTHLIEFRRRALQVLAVFLGSFILFFLFAPNLFCALVQPLLRALPTQDGLIATGITSPFTLPVALAADAAMIATTPFALFHLWRFAAPGLYRHERKRMGWTILGSLLFFCMGILFCFYLILPYMLRFFAQAVPPQVRYLPEITSSVDFIARMLLIFGIFFQLPLLCLVLVRWGWFTVEALKTIRPYVIVGAFILGMLLTPPDVLSQVMVAVPLCVLYEAGIILAWLFAKNALNDDVEAA